MVELAGVYRVLQAKKRRISTAFVPEFPKENGQTFFAVEYVRSEMLKLRHPDRGPFFRGTEVCGAHHQSSVHARSLAPMVKARGIGMTSLKHPTCQTL